MRKINQRLKGTAFIALSALFFSTYGVWSKLMMGFFGEFSQAWTRGLIITMFLILLGTITKQFKKIAKKDIFWFLLISLMGGLNQAPYYYAFKKLEIGTATSLFYASLTIGGFLFGKLFFKEKITLIKLFSLSLAIIGMGLIYGIKIGGGILPLLMAMLAGLMGSAEVVFSKKLSSNYSTVQVLTSIFGTMFIFNLVIAILLGESLPALTLNSAWLGQIGYTISMLGAMYTVVLGFKHLEPSTGALIGLLEIVFAMILGLFFFNEALSWGIMVGAFCIILSAGLLPYCLQPSTFKRSKKLKGTAPSPS